MSWTQTLGLVLGGLLWLVMVYAVGRYLWKWWRNDWWKPQDVDDEDGKGGKLKP